ncbi:hypothetical protein EfmAA290_21910 [Enterococcus faecium]|nr:hypothetical protein EfmAA290_21910 [Enterococcus faecium]
MQGKRKPNGYKEKRGKQAFKRNISERKKDYVVFEEEFGRLLAKLAVHKRFHVDKVLTTHGHDRARVPFLLLFRF